MLVATTIRENIEQSIALCRENGVEPDRVRMSRGSYRILSLEERDASRNMKSICGLAIEVWLTCPPDTIYVDRKPEDEELDELEIEMRAKYGEPNA